MGFGVTGAWDLRRFRLWSLLLFFLGNLGQRSDLVAFIQFHDANALRIPPHYADLIDVRAVYHALGGDQHDVIIVTYRHNADHQAVAVSRANVPDALASAALFAIAHLRPDHIALRGLRLFRSFGNRLAGRFLPLGFRCFLPGNVGSKGGSFAIAVFAHRKQIALGICNDHADDLIAFLQFDALDTARIPAHGAGLPFIEADRHPVPRAQNHLVAGLGQDDADERVAFIQVDADDTAAPGAAVFLQHRLFHDAAPRRHHKVPVGIKPPHRDHAGDFLLRFQREDVGNRPADAGPTHLRY